VKNERCENCGSTESLQSIVSRGFDSCCPEREVKGAMKGTSTPFGELTARDYFHYRDLLWRVIMQEGLAINMDDGSIERFEPSHHVLKVEVKIVVEGGE